MSLEKVKEYCSFDNYSISIVVITKSQSGVKKLIYLTFSLKLTTNNKLVVIGVFYKDSIPIIWQD